MSRRATSIGLLAVMLMAAISLGIVLLADDDTAVRVDQQAADASERSQQEAELQQDVTDLQRAVSRELRQAQTDELTGFEGPPKPEDLDGANGLRGTLVAIPQELPAGNELAVAVLNTGTKQMAFGLGFRVERWNDGTWLDVTRDAIGSGAVRNIGLYAQPGKATGPRYGSLRDAFTLSAELEPGRYRAIKPAGPSLGAIDERGVLLDGRFVVAARGTVP